MIEYSDSRPRFPAVAGWTLTAVLTVLTAGCAARPATEAPAAAPVVATVTPVTSTAEAVAAAGPVRLRADAPLHYTVRKGDTLWDLASYFLRDAWQWPELWYGNQQIRNPHLIYPGQTLTLVMVNGRTRLVAEGPVERLAPKVREEPLASAIPTIPLDVIRNFLRGPRVVSREEVQDAPYVVQFVDEHVAGSLNDDIWVKNLPDPAAGSYAIVRIGDPYLDPDTDRVLGYEAAPAGEAKLRKAGKIAEMRITRSINQEVLVADRLLPLEQESFAANFYPHAPARPVDGRIISVFNGVTEIAQYAIVALNRGSNAGIDPGTVLNAYQSGRTAPDPYGTRTLRLPDSYAGKMMVFKVTPDMSYALVMTEVRSLHVLDRVASPERAPG